MPLPFLPMPSPETEYVLGTNTEEAARLGLQHRLWSSAAHRLWERAGIRPGMNVLDVGCGPGHATMDLAQIVRGIPSGPHQGRVVAVDESGAFLKQLNDEAQSRRLTNIERVLGDVHEIGKLLAGREQTFDLAYARWVFCFLPRPEEVVKGLSLLVKPGGRVAIQDYFNYEIMTLAPKSDAFSTIIRAVGKSWRDQGGDPDVMSRLPAMLRKHGFEVTHLALDGRVARPSTTIWHWPDSFWAVFVPRLEKMGYITTSQREAFFKVWAEASSNPDCFMQLPPVFDLVAEKK